MKRKTIRTFILVLILSVCVCSVAFAAEQPLLSFRYAASGASYRVVVDLRMDSGVEMLQFCLKYDEEKLEVVSIEQGEIFDKDAGSPTFSNPQEGYIFFAWDALQPLQGGELLVVHFKAKTNASGIAVIYIDPDFEAIAADGEYNEIEIEYSKVEVVLGESHEMETPLPTSRATPRPSASHEASTATPVAQATPKPSATQAVETPLASTASSSSQPTSTPTEAVTYSTEVSTASSETTLQNAADPKSVLQEPDISTEQTFEPAFQTEASSALPNESGEKTQSLAEGSYSQQWTLYLFVGSGLVLVLLVVGTILVWRIMKRKDNQ